MPTLLLILIVGGRRGGDTWELWGLVGVGVLALLSLAQYFTYRFRVTADGLEIRSGLLQRSLRNIPWQRVHNVALHQTILHRAFGVAEVRLESAGGTLHLTRGAEQGTTAVAALPLRDD